MVDSIAKIPSGVSDGQLMWTASYFYCTNIEGSYVFNFTDEETNMTESETRYTLGQHCRMSFQLNDLVRIKIYKNDHLSNSFYFFFPEVW